MNELVVKWISLKEMDMVSRVQILNEATFISQGANTFRKRRNRTILSLAQGRLSD